MKSLLFVLSFCLLCACANTNSVLSPQYRNAMVPQDYPDANSVEEFLKQVLDTSFQNSSVQYNEKDIVIDLSTASESVVADLSTALGVYCGVIDGRTPYNTRQFLNYGGNVDCKPELPKIADNYPIVLFSMDFQDTGLRVLKTQAPFSQAVIAKEEAFLGQNKINASVLKEIPYEYHAKFNDFGFEINIRDGRTITVTMAYHNNSNAPVVADFSILPELIDINGKRYASKAGRIAAITYPIGEKIADGCEAGGKVSLNPNTNCYLTLEVNYDGLTVEKINTISGIEYGGEQMPAQHRSMVDRFNF